MNTLEEALRIRAEADCLHPPEAVAAAFDRLAAAISHDYAGRDPLLLCMMNGGLYPTAELTRRLDFAFTQDYLHATRYRGATQGGGLVWKRQPPGEALAGRDVLVIDDILDEGHTLVAVRRALQEFQPARLRVAVLAEKLHDRRAAQAHAEYVGLQVEDCYVFGCGMDYKEYWRQLPAIHGVRR